MEALSLFDFDFKQSQSETEITAAFEILKQEFKKRGNYHCMQRDDLPFQVRSFYPAFVERGWMTIRDSRVYPNRTLLDYHTADEAIEGYQMAAEQYLSREKKCWYTDFLTIRNHSGPFEFKSKEEKEKYQKMKDEITKEVAITLGLDHFINVPSSRGMKMNRFDSKWEKKYVIPMIAERIIPLTDYDEIKEFFNKHAFFCGRRDWTWGNYGIPIPAYPEFKNIMVGSFDIACLAEAKDVKTVALILSYTGGSWCQHDAKRYTILYPNGWSYQKYQESLTFDDLELIYSDMERLNRLHRGCN